MPRRHLQPESYQPCPLCGEPISTQADSCFHCGANDQHEDKPTPAVLVTADYRLDPVHLNKSFPRRDSQPARFKNRRWLRGQNFHVIALMFSLALLLPLLGPFLLTLIGHSGR